MLLFSIPSSTHSCIQVFSLIELVELNYYCYSSVNFRHGFKKPIHLQVTRYKLYHGYSAIDLALMYTVDPDSDSLTWILSELSLFPVNLD